MNKYLKLKKIVLLLVIIVCSCNTIERDWNNTLTINTVDSYEEFIRKYPESDLTNDAKTKIELLEWEKALENNSFNVFSEFIGKYPESQFLADAKSKLEEIDWNKTITTNTIDSYIYFINGYPDSKYLDEATSKQEKLEWNKAKEKDDFESYDYFIKKFPESNQIKIAYEKLADIEWKSVSKINTIDAYNEFLKKFPISKYVNDANTKISKLEYETILSKMKKSSVTICIETDEVAYVYGLISFDISMGFQSVMAGKYKLFIWRGFMGSTKIWAETNGIEIGFVYLLVGKSKLKKLERVDLTKSDFQICFEFGVNTNDGGILETKNPLITKRIVY
jgi:outer membrane protein assembly factor BamD (BamD/ComL family)